MYLQKMADDLEAAKYYEVVRSHVIGCCEATINKIRGMIKT